MMCEACEDGRHADCGMQTWCECECDPETAGMFEDFDPYGEMQWPDHDLGIHEDLDD